MKEGAEKGRGGGSSIPTLRQAKARTKQVSEIDQRENAWSRHRMLQQVSHTRAHMHTHTCARARTHIH